MVLRINLVDTNEKINLFNDTYLKYYDGSDIHYYIGVENYRFFYIESDSKTQKFIFSSEYDYTLDMESEIFKNMYEICKSDFYFAIQKNINKQFMR